MVMRGWRTRKRHRRRRRPQERIIGHLALLLRHRGWVGRLKMVLLVLLVILRQRWGPSTLVA